MNKLKEMFASYRPMKSIVPFYTHINFNLKCWCWLKSLDTLYINSPHKWSNETASQNTSLHMQCLLMIAAFNKIRTIHSNYKQQNADKDVTWRVMHILQQGAQWCVSDPGLACVISWSHSSSSSHWLWKIGKSHKIKIKNVSIGI